MANGEQSFEEIKPQRAAQLTKELSISVLSCKRQVFGFDSTVGPATIKPNLALAQPGGNGITFPWIFRGILWELLQHGWNPLECSSSS